MANELMKVEFESLSGIKVQLDAATVRNTLTRGNGKVSDQEVAMFLRTCQAKRLDPLENGEVWLIKYDDRSPANLVVGYFAYIRRADRFPDYRGFKAGICVAYKDAMGNFLYGQDGMPIVKKKEGAAVYKVLGEVLVGGWCEVYREREPGNIETSYMEVTLEEYSTGKSNWNVKPATMLRKVAVSQAFRAAFPNEYEGLYTADEMVASGAIQVNDYVVDPETGKTVEDPKITQEQRQELFRIARGNLGENADTALRQILSKRGLESTANMTESVYKSIVDDILRLADEMKADQYIELEEEPTGSEEQMGFRDLDPEPLSES